MKKPLPRFGVAGFPPAFEETTSKRELIFEWLAELGLDAMEYQAVYGVKTPRDKAERLGALAREFDIEMSLHAPYYVNLASADEAVQKRSIERMVKAVRLVKWLGGSRVIFHPGGFKGEREKAVNTIISNLKIVEKKHGIEGVFLYPETGGKVGQLGTTDELVTICSEVETAFPCIDWAHEHARSGGSLKTVKDFRAVLETLEKGLGRRALKKMHSHYSQISFTLKGEKAHLPFDGEAGSALPDYRLMLRAFHEKEVAPFLISECRDSQDAGAIAMMQYYGSIPTK